MNGVQTRISKRPKDFYPDKEQIANADQNIIQSKNDAQQSNDDRTSANNTLRKDESSKQAPATSKGQDKTDLSMQSVISSSLAETSEDEEAKRKEKEKKSKKGELGEKDLEKPVDIEIAETETMNILFIPSYMVTLDSEEYNSVDT